MSKRLDRHLASQIVLAGAVFVGLTCLGLTAGFAGTVSEEEQASPAPDAIDMRAVPQGQRTLLQKPAGVAPGAGDDGAPVMPVKLNRSFRLPDARPVPVQYDPEQALERNLTDPTALAAGDFDEDGVRDLIVGYRNSHAGLVTLHRGNVDALYPHHPAARNRAEQGAFTNSPFLSPVRMFEVPATPDFLEVGDFDGDGHRDVVAAARGDDALYLLAGDGRGGLEPARRLDLPGQVTTMLAGEINRADGRIDLIVGISDLSGLEHAVNLDRLYLEQNQISDLGPLTNLSRIYLADNLVSDISPLSNLTGLRVRFTN